MRRLSLRPDEGATIKSQTRLRVILHGAVQGVGFRPFVYRLASDLGLKGWVCNSASGVILEAEGKLRDVEAFLLRLEEEKPPLSFIQGLEPSFLDPVGYTTFQILASAGGEKRALILPDIATCPDCLQEVFDPSNRRFLYPFTNCTHCGPRFSIIESLPYDRPHTTMRAFLMCPECQKEYENPADRRFHAQPNACPQCGPQLECWDLTGEVLATGHEALLRCCEAIRRGLIAAVKGLGGFHLIADATHEEAVARLRLRKHREEKPLAVMVPSLQFAKSLCVISGTEERLLQAPEAPIVLLHRLPGDTLAPSVAPGNPNLGILLPYTPLHHILMRELGFPVIATSGNLSDEPICIDEKEALRRLTGIADLFLVHNRPIRRHVDDSVARVVLKREMLLRRARGYAPFPIHLPETGPAVIATGAHLKNSIALAINEDVFLSQHIGDLDTPEAYKAFMSVTGDLPRMYETEPEQIVCDLHPDYLSTQFALASRKKVTQVQHHFAHILACMAENEIEGPVLGVAWDGTGYGPDGTIWGGEFLVVDKGTFRRVAHLRTFPLPGGDTVARQPRRSLLGLLYEMEGRKAFDHIRKSLPSLFDPSTLNSLEQMLVRGVNTPRTSSAGRLFDTVACLCGLHQVCSYEGQAAMELEFAVGDSTDQELEYPFNVQHPAEEGPRILDWEPMVREILGERESGTPVGRIASRFHNTLVAMIQAVAVETGLGKVVLSGGCFQNKVLTTWAVNRLQEGGFQPYWHQRVPPNDGGIALGQVLAARRYQG
jgi:hydrogenase maturation protein HypF